MNFFCNHGTLCTALRSVFSFTAFQSHGNTKAARFGHHKYWASNHRRVRQGKLPGPLSRDVSQARHMKAPSSKLRVVDVAIPNVCAWLAHEKVPSHFIFEVARLLHVSPARKPTTWTLD